jgi:hypothetical protein
LTFAFIGLLFTLLTGSRCSAEADQVSAQPLWQPVTGLNSEPQNIEPQNHEGWKRFAKSFLKQTEYIHSTFDVGRSMFDVHQFLFRLDRPFFLAGGWAEP